jgi:hypothetical protein
MLETQGTVPWLWYFLFSTRLMIHCNIDWFCFMVFNATFNNISVIPWWSVLLVKETGVSGENHWHAASHWQTLSHNIVSSTPCLSGVRTPNNISGDVQLFVCFMVFNAIFNNISVISWRSVLLAEETGVPGENHGQTLLQNVVSRFETMLVVIGTDCTGSCKSNYHTTTTTTAPFNNEIPWNFF